MKKVVLSLIFLLATNALTLAQGAGVGWVARFNGPANINDVPAAIAVDDSGSIYVTGYCDEDYMSSNSNFLTVRYYREGDTAWTRAYDNTSNRYDYAKTIMVDDSGYIYVSGDSYGTAEDILTVKYGADGNEHWVRRYNGPGNGEDHVKAMAVAADGSVHIFGDSDSGGEDDDFVTIKYTTGGDTAWIERFAGPVNGYEEQAGGIAVDDVGNVYVTGSSARPGLMSDFLTIRYYSDGDTAWTRWYNGPADSIDWSDDIAIDNSGNIFVSGRSWGGDSGFDIVTIKYDSDGTEIWVRRFDGEAGVHDGPAAITTDISGNVYITGYCNHDWDFPPASSTDIVTIKYLANGDTAWISTYDGPESESDGASAIAVDDYGNTYVTGYATAPNYTDYVTIKYDQSGVQMWLKQYDGNAGGRDEARGLALDDSGSVYVTGRSGQNYGYPENYDYATIKYIPYICGDADGSEDIDMLDIIHLIAYLYKGGPPPVPAEAGDPDSDGKINMLDILHLIAYLYKGGTEPLCP